MHMLNDNAQEENDVIFVDRRKVERAIIGMQGLYKLARWVDASGAHREFSCRVLKMSSGIIEITGPVTGSVGEWVAVHLERFGQFEGPVIRTGERRLVVRIVATNDDRHKIARKIAWLENKKIMITGNTPGSRLAVRIRHCTYRTAAQCRVGSLIIQYPALQYLLTSFPSLAQFSLSESLLAGSYVNSMKGLRLNF